ncbi:immunoglobulin I-set domain protein [Cooperia oncophora]
MPFKQPLGERADENRVAPSFIRPLADKRAVVGERVVLQCQLDGHPTPAVKWLKDGHNVSNCPDYEIQEDGHVHRLIISQVHSADSGRFTAQVVVPPTSSPLGFRYHNKSIITITAACFIFIW